MFEEYTETARRIIFFARYEASQHGSREIGPTHPLLGAAHDHGLYGRLATPTGRNDRGRVTRSLLATSRPPFYARFQRSTGLRAAVTSSTRPMRVV